MTDISDHKYEVSYTEDGCVEVLVSPDYGAGWVTWNGNDIQLGVDKRIIDFFKAHVTKSGRYFDPPVTDEDLSELFTSIGITRHLYFGGWDSLKIVKVPRGTLFTIREYDGAEYIHTFDASEYWRF